MMGSEDFSFLPETIPVRLLDEARWGVFIIMPAGGAKAYPPYRFLQTL